MSTVYGEIEAKRSSILKAWRTGFNRASTASCSASPSKGNRFTDPVGFLVDEAAGDLIDWLAGAGDAADIPASLADWCRLRAVEETTPSRALGFILDLKRAVRSALGDTSFALDEVDARIDEAALFAFDRFAESREKLNQIRIDEVQRGEGLMRRRRAAERGGREREAV